ncbi:hypothetical protein ACF08N_36685, partial [Streptomyces sp. NPDC015127]
MVMPHDIHCRLPSGRDRRSPPPDRNKLTQLEKAITQLRRERGRLNVRAIAERAGVSATFCYENRDARVLVRAAVADARQPPATPVAEHREPPPADQQPDRQHDRPGQPLD